MVPFKHVTIGQMAGNRCTLSGFRKALYAMLDKLDRINPNTDALQYRNGPGETPGYLRHMSTGDNPMDPFDLQIYYGLSDDDQRQMEISIYLYPEPGKPSFTISETAASDLSNVPPADASIDALKQLVRRWLRIAGDPAPSPIPEPIAYSDLPRLLTTLVRSQHGESALASGPDLQIDETGEYGRLIIGQIINRPGPGYDLHPIATQPLLDYLAARVPLELQLYKKVSQRPSRKPEDGLPRHVTYTLRVPGDLNWEWNFSPLQVAEKMTAIDELKILRPLAHLGSDLLLPFVQSKA